MKYNPADSDRPGICQGVVALLSSSDPCLQITGMHDFFPLLRIQDMLEHGKLDLFFCMLRSPEREKKFRFIDIPIYKIRHVVAVRADDPVSVSDFDDIRKLGRDNLILVNQGSALVRALEKENLRFDAGAKDEKQNFNKLLSKRGRFFYGQDLNLLRAIKDLKIEGRIKILPAVFYEEGQYLALSKNLPLPVVERVKVLLSRLQASGELDAVARNYRRRLTD